MSTEEERKISFPEPKPKRLASAKRHGNCLHIELRMLSLNFLINNSELTTVNFKYCFTI